jgi:transcriptional regulator with XRE-family HTH domain
MEQFRIKSAAHPEEEMLRAIGSNIRRERKLLRYSQESFAAEAGFHKSFIGSVERGEQRLTLESFYKLADALNLYMYELIPDTCIGSDELNTQCDEKLTGTS